MLRCPPSRISLTADDLNDFDDRLRSRQHARLALLHQANLRLSPGPNHDTKHATIEEERNPSRHRHASYLSRATLCSAEGADGSGLPVLFASDSSGGWAVDTPINVHDQHTELLLLSHEADISLQNAVRERQSTSKPSSKAAGKRPAQSSTSEPNPAEHALRFVDSTLDGALDFHPAASPPRRRRGDSDVEPSQRGVPVLGNIRVPTGPPSRNDVPALDVARARRSDECSDDTGFRLHEDPAALQHLVQTRHIQRPPSTGYHPDVPLAVPELVLPEEIAEDAQFPNLDPGAPVFVPHVRFGTAGRSSLGEDTTQHWGSLDTTRSAAHLRLRTSSEQNLEQPNRHRNDAAQARYRRRSRTTDQNAPASQQPQANLDRYPLLRPPSRQTLTSNSGSRRVVPIPGRRVTRIPSVGTVPGADVRHPVPSEQSAPSDQAPTAQLDGPEIDAGTFPIEHHIQPRSSSLAWGRVNTPTHRVPSMVSAASGISSSMDSRQSSSSRSRDAVAEFLRMRNSPLDELTERLSHISASRPRSVGRSWERLPNVHSRVSLLSGDPFRQDAPPEDASSLGMATMPASALETLRVMRAHIEPEPALDNALPLNAFSGLRDQVLPTSSATLVSPLALPSTPPTQQPNSSSPRKPLEQRSPVRPRSTPKPDSAIKRKPLPFTAATPKVKIYNDSEPPNTQPQAPADVVHTARKRRGQSDTAAHAQDTTSSADRAASNSPSGVSKRHADRNIYPSTSPVQVAAPTSPQAASPAAITIVESLRREDVRRRAETNVTRQERENDEVEGHSRSLELDRRTWMRRRQGGSLETTPPAEGRFERFLS